MEFLVNNMGILSGVGGGSILLILLKKIPNEKICSVVENCFYGIGCAVTLGLAKWKFSKKVWNKTLEPYFTDLVDNLIGGAVRGFIEGLRSDNK